MLRVIYSSLLVVCSDIAHLSSAFAGTYLLLPVEITCLENLFLSIPGNIQCRIKVDAIDAEALGPFEE